MDLGCESDPDSCEVLCNNSGELARIGVEASLAPLALDSERSHAFRTSLTTHNYAWVSILFPGDSGDDWTASFATFHGGTSVPQQTCASISVGVPGLPPIIELEDCEMVGEIPPCDESESVVADEDEGERSDLSESYDVYDTSWMDDTTVDSGSSPRPPFLTDTNRSGGNLTPDTSGNSPDQTTNEEGLTGESYENPAYDGCACDLNRSNKNRWGEAFFFLLTIGLGMTLLRTSIKPSGDIR